MRYVYSADLTVPMGMCVLIPTAQTILKLKMMPTEQSEAVLLHDPYSHKALILRAHIPQGVVGRRQGKYFILRVYSSFTMNLNLNEIGIGISSPIDQGDQ